MTPQTIKTGRQYRHFTLDRAVGIDPAARTIDLAFASEAPVNRFFGMEVLDCTPGSCRLDRLNNGGALLDNHDPDEQIGVVESARVDPDRICRATVRFSKAAEADEIFQDVLDGIRRHVSVGYQLYKYVEETTVAADGEEDTICRVTDWEPIEISIVAVPADPTVGVNRSIPTAEIDTVITRNVPEEPEKTVHISTPASTTPPKDKTMDDTAQATGREAEQKRAADLLALADTYAQFGARDMVANAIRNGHSTEQFLNAVMGKISERHSNAHDLEIGLTDKEKGSYSIMRAVQAALTGDWQHAGLERAASEAVAKRSGFKPEGFFVPVEAFSRGFTAGTAAEAGNLIQTSVLGNEFVDVLRNAKIGRAHV